MKPKILLLSLFFVLAGVYASASGIDPQKPIGPGTGDDEVNGSIIHAETKKPLKDVTVTAYISSKKEKHVITDDAGHFEFDDLKPGIYKLVFEKEGYRKITREKVVIKTDEAFQLNIEMFELSDFDVMPSPFHIIGN